MARIDEHKLVEWRRHDLNDPRRLLAESVSAIESTYVREVVVGYLGGAVCAAVAERQELATTLSSVDFADDVQRFLDALDAERDTPGACTTATQQLDALIQAVVRKVLS